MLSNKTKFIIQAQIYSDKIDGSDKILKKTENLI